jgi:hypothetical protein
MNRNQSSVMTEAVLRAGLVTEKQLKEMKRWAPPSLDPDAVAEEPKSLEEAATLIGDALQSEGYVLMRETDLEAVRQYVETSNRSILHIELDGAEGQDIEVTFGKTPIGEYVIAWKSESIHDAMTNGLTHLRDGTANVFFRDVRELFFGATKAFMVCVPSKVEHAQR